MNARAQRRLPIMVLALFAGAALLGLARADVAAGGVSAAASITPSRVNIGTPVSYGLRIEYPGKLEVDVADLAPLFAAFEIRHSSESTRRNWLTGRIVRVLRYELAAYTIGKHTIPWPEITYSARGSSAGEAKLLKGPASTLDVVSLLGEKADDIRAIKGPLALPPHPWKWAVPAGSAFMILVAAIAFALLRRRKRAREAPVPLPHEFAYRCLDELASTYPENLEQAGRFYLRLSMCVRRYIEARFGICAPSRTTEEFLHALSRDESPLGSHANLLRNFLAACDMVKFAMYYPAAEEIRSALSSARRFVDETKPAEDEVAALEVAER